MHLKVPAFWNSSFDLKLATLKIHNVNFHGFNISKTYLLTSRASKITTIIVTEIEIIVLIQ